MILFGLICLVLIAIALAFVLPPLRQSADTKPSVDDGSRKEANVAVYRDQIAELEADLNNGIIDPEQYQEDREALERRLLDDVALAEDSETVAGDVIAPTTARPGRSLAFSIALAIPLVAIALYLSIGNPKALSLASGSSSPVAESPNPAGPRSPMVDGRPSQQQIEANVASLAKRMEQSPNDVQGWIMLARSYASLEKYHEAAGAYAKATALKPDDADLWADYAFATAIANDRRLQGPALALVNKALAVDPENPKALQLAGSAAFEVKDYQRAIEYWQRLSQKAPPDSEMGRELAERIAEAKQLSGGTK